MDRAKIVRCARRVGSELEIRATALEQCQNPKAIGEEVGKIAALLDDAIALVATELLEHDEKGA